MKKFPTGELWLGHLLISGTRFVLFSKYTFRERVSYLYIFLNPQHRSSMNDESPKSGYDKWLGWISLSSQSHYFPGLGSLLRPGATTLWGEDSLGESDSAGDAGPKSTDRVLRLKRDCEGPSPGPVTTVQWPAHQHTRHEHQPLLPPSVLLPL